MSENIIKDQYFELAENYIRYTHQAIFLTGKAGTGKSTFLKYIKNQSHKNLVVLAPTGVAAINAGGSTIHSFFNLPFAPFIPQRIQGLGNQAEALSEIKLFARLRYRKDKIQLLRELELLIIDEISMVRCDVLDAIDSILRYYRGRPYLPFGGVQVLLIGDVLQLPPIAKPEEWDILRQFYRSVFFFHSKVIEENPLTQIRFEHIFRQKDEQFIDLLNHIRDNNVQQKHIDLLGTRYSHNFEPEENERYITITTHRHKADKINNKKLAELPGEEFTFMGSVEGNFSESSLPCEKELKLKVGAQVMFVKNDPSFPRRFYNGKIATVAEISKNEISVILDENLPHDLYPVPMETWRNYAYTYDKDKKTITEEIVGEFSQYPLRTAWAITIHKSQGLTFDKVIIDAEEAFAPGQTYVALSRCRSLEGIVLRTPVKGYGLKYDETVKQFSSNLIPYPRLMADLAEKKKLGQQNFLKSFFHFHAITDSYRNLSAEITEHSDKFENPVEYLSWAKQQYQAAAGIFEVGLQFQDQLQKIFSLKNEEKKRQVIKDRVEKALIYFSEEVTEKLLIPTVLHINRLPDPHKMHLYKKSLNDIKETIIRTIEKLQETEFDTLEFEKPAVYFKSRINDALQAEEQQEPKPAKAEKKTRKKTAKEKKEPLEKKPKKPGKREITLQLFKEGQRQADIAKELRITLTTVDKYLFSYIETGEIKLHDLLLKKEIKAINQFIDEYADKSASEILKQGKEKFPPAALEVILRQQREL